MADTDRLMPETIDSTFRNGSLTVIGIVLAFSLGFLNQWATSPGVWQPQDVATAAIITVGIAFQIWAIARMMAVASLQLSHYHRTVRLFFAGLLIMALGVIIAVFLDFAGYGQQVLHR